MCVRSKKRNHIMEVSYEEFSAWSLESPEFWKLYSAWRKANYPQNLSPSVNRKDNSKGYSLENMEWISMLDNVQLGTKDRYNSQRLPIKRTSKP